MDRSWQHLIDSSQSHVHLNPALNKEISSTITTVALAHQSDVPLSWIMSSGTTSTSEHNFKLIALAAKAFLCSAQAVNAHLEVTANDRWYNLLPLFHVGGLGILYRAQSSNTECINRWEPGYKWNPIDFVKDCERSQITLTSLVPTQIYDLVQAQIPAPKCLRAIVIGGARLTTELYTSARQLGWPLLPSFGMTEAASQIATARLESLTSAHTEVPLQVLSHLRVATNADQQLLVAGTSLLEGYYEFQQGQQPLWVQPKDALGWYKTQDRVLLENNELTVLSRLDDVIKVRGENVNLASLRQRFEALHLQLNIQADCALLAIPDARTGHKIIAAGTEDSELFAKLIETFNQSSLPFERIEQRFAPVEIPKSSLGKVRYELLLTSLLKP